MNEPKTLKRYKLCARVNRHRRENDVQMYAVIGTKMKICSSLFVRTESFLFHFFSDILKLPTYLRVFLTAVKTKPFRAMINNVTLWTALKKNYQYYTTIRLKLVGIAHAYEKNISPTRAMVTKLISSQTFTIELHRPDQTLSTMVSWKMLWRCWFSHDSRRVELTNTARTRSSIVIEYENVTRNRFHLKITFRLIQFKYREFNIKSVYAFRRWTKKKNNLSLQAQQYKVDKMSLKFNCKKQTLRTLITIK